MKHIKFHEKIFFLNLYVVLQAHQYIEVGRKWVFHADCVAVVLVGHVIYMYMIIAAAELSKATTSYLVFTTSVCLG